jgi:hypothetical protein
MYSSVYHSFVANIILLLHTFSVNEINYFQLASKFISTCLCWILNPCLESLLSSFSFSSPSIWPPLAHRWNGGQTHGRIGLGLMTSACLWFHGKLSRGNQWRKELLSLWTQGKKNLVGPHVVSRLVLLSEVDQRNDSRGTSLLSYPAVLNSHPFPVIHLTTKEGLNCCICQMSYFHSRRLYKLNGFFVVAWNDLISTNLRSLLTLYRANRSLSCSCFLLALRNTTGGVRKGAPSKLHCMQNSARLRELGIIDNYPYFRNTVAISQGRNKTNQCSEDSESTYDHLQDDDVEWDSISSNGNAKVLVLPTSQSLNCCVLTNTF